MSRREQRVVVKVPGGIRSVDGREMRSSSSSNGRYISEFVSSGMVWVAAVFGGLICINLATLAVGASAVLRNLYASPTGPILAPFVFDSWGTIAGLAGAVLLFGPVLFGAPVARRRELSLYFTISSLGLGELAVLAWDWTYGRNEPYGSGSSGLAITALGIICALSVFGLLRLARQDTRGLGRLSSHWWYSFVIIYLTMIASSLWFILALEPIFVPTALYNWRVHEFGFLLGLGVTAGYAGSRWAPLGLDGILRIDESLMNYHFDDLSPRFPSNLQKVHVVFRNPVGREVAEYHPELQEIWVSERFRGTEYRAQGPEFEKALLHAMVHEELLQEGASSANSDATARFNEIASRVGAPPEA